MFFFFPAPKLLTVIKHVFRRDKEFKGRDVAFVSDWLTKKVFKRSLLKTGGADDDCSLVGNDRQIRRLGWAFEHHFGLSGRELNLNDPIFKRGGGAAEGGC